MMGEERMVRMELLMCRATRKAIVTCMLAGARLGDGVHGGNDGGFRKRIREETVQIF
jgi:hypothetical protein